MGTCLPENKVSSDRLEKELSIPCGWSARYSGVCERYHSTFESNAYLGARALERALENAGLEPADIGLLISGAATYDYPLPNQSSMIKFELLGEGKPDFPCIDIDTTCLSFVTALDYAAKSLDPERCRHIAVVSAEIASKGIDRQNWETATLFGDAAAAVIISVDETHEHGLIKHDMRTYSEGAMNTIIRGGGNRFFFKDHPYDPKLHSFSMDGKKLLRLAKARIPEFMASFFGDLPIRIEDVHHILPHQASKAGLMTFISLYGFTDEQVESNLEEQGNCIAASIPSLLCKAVLEKRISDGELCLLCGTSAGFSIGAVLIRY